MEFVVGKRGTGRSTRLLYLREKTGGIIITSTAQSAKYLREKAQKIGYSDRDIYAISDKIFKGGFRFRPNEHVYIDNAEFIFKQWFAHTFYDDPEKISVQLTAAITTKNDSDYLTQHAPVFRKEWDCLRKE